MSFLKKYSTDKVLEEAGVWVVLDEDVEIKVARLNCKSAKDLRRALERPYRNFSGGPPESVQEENLRKILAQAVLKDWKGVTDLNGKEIKFTPAAAEELFVALPDFLGDVITAAAARETFATDGLENSKNE